MSLAYVEVEDRETTTHRLKTGQPTFRWDVHPVTGTFCSGRTDTGEAEAHAPNGTHQLKQLFF
ncbi:hypothetical protein [Cystobacter fuscus]|uniref:hypothetical protein n=1 Tax=Cystobacter fuscus TaxID=43 RepID=UPI0012FD3560|nr:hypothetical protein [Cystobacter fuscus]